MSHADRKRTGNTTENRFAALMEKHDCPCRRIGAENYERSTKWDQRLRELDTPDARERRYPPDFECLTSRGFAYFEIKSSNKIERHCYEELQRRQQIGQYVRLIVQIPTGQLVQIDPAQVVFVAGDKMNSLRIPIVDTYWRCPRLWPAEKLAQWLANNPKASGTSFALIDLQATPHTIIPEG